MKKILLATLVALTLAGCSGNPDRDPKEPSLLSSVIGVARCGADRTSCH